jgi:hypothetical protein
VGLATPKLFARAMRVGIGAPGTYSPDSTRSLIFLAIEIYCLSMTVAYAYFLNIYLPMQHVKRFSTQFHSSEYPPVNAARHFSDCFEIGIRLNIY